MAPQAHDLPLDSYQPDPDEPAALTLVVPWYRRDSPTTEDLQ